MAYLGNAPTSVPLTSSDITDGIITSAKIADGTITGTDINSTFNLTGKTVTLPSGVGGKVLQVVSTTISSALAISANTSYVDITGLSATITPSSASNKILVLHKILMSNASGGNGVITLDRNGTSIALGDSGTGTRGTISMNLANMENYRAFDFGGSFLDSPSSTSALTYKFKVICNDGASTFHFNRTARLGTSDILGISTITLMEIAG
jgi:hypothetical protein